MHEISAIRLITDTVIFIASLSLILATYTFVRPYHTPAIACTSLADHSQKIVPSTVSDLMLAAQCILAPLGIILLSEALLHLTLKSHRSYKVHLFNKYSMSIPALLAHTYKYFGAHMAGLSAVTLLTTLAKGTVGRMRPYFLTLCDPVFNLRNSSSLQQLCITQPILYMGADFECRAGDRGALLEAQFSFPSGHASQGFYAMVFMCLYLGARWRRFAGYLTLIVQSLLLAAAFFTALTRIADSKHFYSDVAVGSVIGVCGAFAAFYQLLGKARFFAGESDASKKYSLLRVNHACSRSSSQEASNKELV